MRNAIFFAFWAFSGAALAQPLAGPEQSPGQLQVQPTFVQIAPQDRAGILTLVNTGKLPVHAQVEVHSWAQINGEESTTPTKDVLASPMIVEVPANSTQIVRFLNTKDAATGTDKMYRVVVQQIPDKDEPEQTGIVVRMRYTLPLYLRAQNAPSGTLACSISYPDLTCQNSGGQAIQMGETRLNKGSSSTVISKGLFGYVLPQSSKTWRGVVSQEWKDAGSLTTKTQGRETTVIF